jgi:hypothetical protein
MKSCLAIPLIKEEYPIEQTRRHSRRRLREIGIEKLMGRSVQATAPGFEKISDVISGSVCMADQPFDHGRAARDGIADCQSPR